MKERNITITLKEAREYYNSGNATLKEIALKAFSEEELNVFDFTKIKTFKDALLCVCELNSPEYRNIVDTLKRLSTISTASAAMLKLNIVKTVLNTGYDLHLTKNVEGQKYTWCPYVKFVTKTSTYYDDELKDGEYKKLGEIMNDGVIYNVIYSCNSDSDNTGLGYFYSNIGVGYAYTDFGFLGCATEEIADHFGKYFGMLILEAMYGDLIDFKIVNDFNRI